MLEAEHNPDLAGGPPMKHHVTVGVDGSSGSRAATRWGAWEASLRQVPLRLVHAVDWPTGPALPGWGLENADQWADEALTEALEDVRRLHPQVEVTTRCLSGRPAADLAAEATGTGLLVLGSRSLGRLVGDALPSRYGEIVVGIDIHEAAGRVLSFPFEEAGRRACPLRAVRGWKLPAAYMPPSSTPTRTGSRPERHGDAGRHAAAAAPQAPVRRRHPRGLHRPTGQHLVQAAANADLAIASRHLPCSPLGAHLGRVAHAVLHHAAAPVVVIAP
ncbi:universal stress protein [Streptomyces sp. NPDC002467]|uniref:universal stress protein n=1 Tax=Streptomyces sp. NPDC002467 TaxID=3364647 RepID=UPI0036AD26DF